MKLQIISDSHMQVDVGKGQEYGLFEFPVAAPNLALLGGMGRVCDGELFDFIRYQLGRFERVFYILGLDELYGSDLPETIRAMKRFDENLAKSSSTSNSGAKSDKKFGVFHFLYRTRVDLENVTILGCTLWCSLSNRGHNKRVNSQHSFRPIQEFYAEEEQAERELDISWLEAELKACANGEDSARAGPIHDNETFDVPEDPIPTAQEYVEEDEGDIYDDEPMSPPPTEAIAEASVENAQASVAEASDHMNIDEEPSTSTAKSRHGPAKRVLVLSYFPPTYNEITHSKWKPYNYKNDDVETLLKNQQCWALPDGMGNGVFVHSPLHGNGAPLASPFNPPTDQAEPSGSSEQVCTHNEAVDPNSDPLRPPGLAAWAFSYSRWSCDIQYDVNKPRPTSDYHHYGKSKPPPHNLLCPSCKRVPAPVRMVSNQRGQQWERNRRPYIDVPAGWRAFDDAFVIEI